MLSKGDRNENASKNIEKVGIGHCHDSKQAVREHKTTSVAIPVDPSRIIAALAR